MNKQLISLLVIILLSGCGSAIHHKKADVNTNSDVLMKDRAPEKLNDPRPVYPESALANGYEAVVWVGSTIDSTGQVVDVKIEKVIGKENVGFEESAIKAAFATKWIPPIIDGKVSGNTVFYKIVFELRK